MSLCNNIDCKKLAKLTIVTFVVVWITDFLIHGKLLVSMYMETANLWRTEDEMQNYMWLTMLGQFVVSLFIARIFMHGYKGTGVKEGLRYGILLGGLNAGHCLIMHCAAPYPTNLTVAWIVAGFVQAMIVGAVLTKVAK